MEEHRAKGGSGAAVDRKERRIFLFRIEACRLHHIAVQLHVLICKGKFLHRAYVPFRQQSVVEGRELLFLPVLQTVNFRQPHIPHSGIPYGSGSQG